MLDNTNTHHSFCGEDLVQLLLHIFKLLEVIELSRLCKSEQFLLVVVVMLVMVVDY
jgi:hypothetical protein